jgi:hypothetical protein
LRLNHRLSPALYLDVLPLVETAGHYAFTTDETGTVVDYTLKMRQFDQATLFSHLFQAGQLTATQLRSLASLLAIFHAEAATDDEIRANGSVAAIRTVETNNYTLSEPFIGRTQTQAQYDETRAFTTQFLTQHADWFLRRQAQDKIRDCHGDLHLNNVCLYQDQIQIFDCIEFNDAFRHIDVIYDMAFMVMDLAFQGRHDLANIFLNTYLEETGDYEGAAVLPLYLSMRAYIRGNVNSLALDDPAIATTEKSKFQEQAQAYYHLAWRYTHRSLGYLILMSGISGSGKSTVAKQLAPQIQAIHLRSDAIRKHLAGLPIHQRGANSLYTTEMTQATYARLLELGILLACQGWPVILDAKYDRVALRTAAINAAQDANLSIQIVECVAPPEVLRERLQSRTGDITDATVNLLEAQVNAAEPLNVEEQMIATTLPTDQPIEISLTELLQKSSTSDFSYPD